jgi:hypothetical protein
LRRRTDGIDGADDGAVGIAATEDGRHDGTCQSEPEWRPEGLRCGPNKTLP